LVDRNGVALTLNDLLKWKDADDVEQEPAFQVADCDVSVSVDFGVVFPWE